MKNLARSYLLFRGPLDAIDSFLEPAFHAFAQSPNIWWPIDRAWCVATEIDLSDSFIGGSEECIQRILARPDLETFPVTIEARIDCGVGHNQSLRPRLPAASISSACRKLPSPLSAEGREG